MELELTDEQRLERDLFRRWFTTELEPRVPEMERGELLPYGPMRDMHAGLGLEALSSPFARTTFMVEMSRVSPSFALSYGASTGLFGANVLGKGTAEQVQQWAIPVLRCERVGAWGLTEPGAGSDALRGMKTTARRDGDQWVLRGSKTFITNAPYADSFLIYARASGGDVDGTVQAFLVERADAGVSTGPPMKKMGMRGSPTGEVFLDDVRLPADRLLGGGVKQRDHVKSSLAVERGGLAVISLGIAERCFEIARDYAKTREQFGQPIGSFQAIKHACAEMLVEVENSHGATYYAAWAIDAAAPDAALAASVAKSYVGEASRKVCGSAIQVHGGIGFTWEYDLHLYFKQAKFLESLYGDADFHRDVVMHEVMTPQAVPVPA
jgi:hypothetical protein